MTAFAVAVALVCSDLKEIPKRDHCEERVRYHCLRMDEINMECLRHEREVLLTCSFFPRDPAGQRCIHFNETAKYAATTKKVSKMVKEANENRGKLLEAINKEVTP